MSDQLEPFIAGDFLTVGGKASGVYHIPRINTLERQGDGSWLFVWSTRFTSCSRVGTRSRQLPELDELCGVCRASTAAVLAKGAS